MAAAKILVSHIHMATFLERASLWCGSVYATGRLQSKGTTYRTSFDAWVFSKVRDTMETTLALV